MLHPDDMKFFANLAEAIIIATIQRYADDAGDRYQEAYGYIAEAREMIADRTPTQEDKSDD